MQTFSLTTNRNNNFYHNISLNSALIILSDYFAEFGDGNNSDFELTCEQTGELILLETIFTTKNNSKHTFSELFELLPYYSQISPITL